MPQHILLWDPLVRVPAVVSQHLYDTRQNLPDPVYRIGSIAFIEKYYIALD
jgi:hypothetical protein